MTAHYLTHSTFPLENGHTALVHAATREKSLDSLRMRGMMVSFGNASGPVPDMKPLLLSQKGSIFLTRPTLFHYCTNREEMLARATPILNWIAEGNLSISIFKKYPIAEAGKAHLDLESRKSRGKLLLEP